MKPRSAVRFALAALLLLPLVPLVPVRLASAAPLKIFAMESAPVSFSDNGHATGLVVEVAREVQRRAGSSDPIEIVPWARAYSMAGIEPNVVLLSIVRTAERERTMRFVGPIFQTEMWGYALRSRLDQLRAQDPGWHHVRAGGRRGSIFVSRAREQGYNVTEELNATDTAVRMLMAGRFDLWFESNEIVAGAMRQAGHPLEEVAPVTTLGTDMVYFAFSHGTPDSVVQTWDAALKAMKRDGSFQKLHQHWMPGHALPPPH